MGTNTRSATAAATTTSSDDSCSAAQPCEGPNCNTSDSCQESSSSGSLAENDRCALDAENGLCISNPEEMFQKCSPDDYCLNRPDFGAFVLASPVYRSETPGNCQNDDEDCEHFAVEELACLFNPNYMRESCPKSCYMCFENEDGSDASLVKIPIGVKQTMPSETTEDEKRSFYEVIAETTSYMAEEVFAKKEFEEGRRHCRNVDDRCAWNVASTHGAYCEDPDSTHLCGPACKVCGEIVLTADEHEMLYECTPDYTKDIFENSKPEKSDNGEDSDESDNSRTLDAMFRRIVGELPYPSSSREPYPIVPGVNYTVNVLSRPSLNPKIHTNMSRDSIDFHIGGPWIVVLEDFLSPEECDRLIELGYALGRERSTIHDDPDEEEDENDKEETEVNDEAVKEEIQEEEEAWRTSTTAWCKEEVCMEDPIAKRIHDRIGFTTGVTDESYYEYFQLLKYGT